MSRATATALIFLFATALALPSPNKLSLKGRKLPADPATKSQILLGTSAFILGSLLQITFDPSEPRSVSGDYNRLFLNAAQAQETESLEVILAYATTYQKDLRMACKLAVMTRINDHKQQAALKPRCEFWAETIIKELPMTPRLFDIQFAFKTFYILHRDERQSFRSLSDESSEEAAYNDQLFFDTLGKVIEEVMNGKDDDIAQIRFHLIQRFYGPKFALITDNVIDTDYKLDRATINFNDEQQDQLDHAYGIPLDIVTSENYRLRRDRHRINAPDQKFKDYEEQNIYRYYGRNFDQPIYDVKKIFKIWDR